MDPVAGLNDLDALLGHTHWLRRLAARLTRDPSEADDLVQETVLVALASRPSERSPFNAWLARVLRNLAAGLGRQDDARKRRERSVARREAALPHDEIVAAVDLQRRLAQRVLELPEPYRTAVLLRYYEELSAADIARRLDVPAATVRSRVLRGLALLRERMDLGDGEGRDWRALVGALWTFGGASADGVVPGAVVGTGATNGVGWSTGAILMKTKTVAASALLVACALLSYFGLLRPDPANGASTSRAEAASATDAGDRFAAHVATVSGAASRAAVGRSPFAAHDDDSSPPSIRDRILRAVDDESSEPVPGAEIFVFEGMEAIRSLRGRHHAAGEDTEGLFRSQGRRFVTDAAGEARLPLSATAPWAAAVLTPHKAGLGGGASPETGGPVTVRLVARSTIRCRVVDSAGRPLGGIRVGLVAALESADDRDLLLESKSSSAASGDVEFSNLLANDRMLRGSSNKMPVAVKILSLAPDAARVPLDPREPPATPIVLRAAPTGAVVVAVNDRAGRPKRGEIDVCLAAQFAGSDVHMPIDHLIVPLANGEAVFENVALGLKLKAAAGRYPPTGRGEPVVVDGPRTAGERTRIAVTWDERPVVSGRFVDAAGAPIASTRVVVAFAGEGQMPVVSDEAGRIRIFVLPPSPNPKPVVFLTDSEAPRRIALVSDPIALGDPATLGRDLGDVVLHEAGILGAGRIVDDDGRPRPDVTVLLATSDDEPIPGVAPAVTGADGGFVFRGRSSAYEFVASAPGLFDFQASTPRRFVKGATDVVLVATRPARIAGSVRVDGPLPHDAVRAELRRISADGLSAPQSYASVNVDGAFEFGGLEAGDYEVALRVGSDAASSPVRVSVRRGETSADPRLQGMALVGGVAPVRSFKIEVVDDVGAPVPAGWVLRMGQGRDARWVEPTAIARGKAPVFTQAEHVDLRIQSRGFRTTVFNDIEGDRRLVLPRGVTVRLALAPEVVLPAEPWRLGATLTRAGGSYVVGGGTEPPLDPWFEDSRTLDLVLEEPGRFDLGWMLWRTVNGKPKGVPIPVASRRLVVPDSTAPVPFEISISADAVRAAMMSDR